VKTPEAFVEAPRQNVVNDAAALAEWWTHFSDAELTSLVERAIANNMDVRVAEARLREARASLRYTQANMQPPTVNLNGTYARSKTSAENPQSSELGGGTALSPTTDSMYQVYFDASYELDLFGGVRRQVEASVAGAQSTIPGTTGCRPGNSGVTPRHVEDHSGPLQGRSCE
jgi:outer membrane protein, multidrug efflux system